MKIFYNCKSSKWSHITPELEVTIGGVKQVISPQILNPESVPFNLQYKNGHVGPIIGILTAKKTDGSIAGNGPLFTKLQKKLISQKGISFIFTPDEVSEVSIDGYTFLPNQNQWIKIKMPYPDLVYNRVPFRSTEQGENFQTFIQGLREKKIPFFNPRFIDKFELYQHFTIHPILQAYTPHTEQIQNSQHLYSFLEKFPTAYLKPANSSKGNGIFRIKLINSTELSLEGVKKIEHYQSIQDFWDQCESTLINKNYIIQEEIPSALIDGKRFDFRILAHADNDNYVVTGIGIRQSQEQDITTHLPNGGKLLPYHLIQSNEHDTFINEVVELVGKTLSEKLGYFGEFSIDAGINTFGKYYIYEVNSKPMSFDEEEIEERKINHLCRLFLLLTGFEYLLT
ncbi:MAG: YheC/YheD family protein [Bacillota bacterium]|nr:YheC/YheD family protein [Bacillota bacterium]